MYKMVSLPTMASGTKDSGIKASQMSYRAFTTGLNRIGATINSTIVINKQIKDALVQNLKLKDKEFEEEKKRFQKEKEEKNKIQKKSGSGFLGGVAEVAAKMTGGFLSGLAGIAGALMKFVITQSVLRWIGNPANIQKLIQIVSAIINVVTFFARFLRDNIVKMFDGLATMLDGNKNIFQKLGGFVTFITGFGAILGGALILKKPGLVLKGVGWVLKTLWTNLSKTKGTLAKRAAGGAAKGASSGFGSWSSSQGAKGARGGRLGGIAKGLAAASTIAVPIVVGAQMASGPDEFSSAPGSVSGGTGGGGDTGLPQLAMGGIATRPTSALIGEDGPEVRMPLSNAKAMQNSGIKPLSSLGGMFKGGGDTKQAQKLSDLFIAPFKGVGAGILANISQIVSGMGPAGQALTPILGNIITPIANSFGVPPSLVKTLTSKTQVQGKTKQKTGQKGDTAKLFGKGKLVKTDDKKFKKVADTSVLGLLSNMLAAVQVIGNKVGGTGPRFTPDNTPGAGAPSDSIDQSSASAAAAGAKGAGSTDQSRKGATDAMKAGQQSQTSDNYSSKASDRKGGEVKFKGPNKKPYKVIINATNGDYEVWEDWILGRQVDISVDKNTPIKQKAMNQVRAYFVNNAPQKGLELKYLTEDDIKNKQKLLDAAKKEQSAAAGGWISGPMSGYPVSLDGGGSTAFIGHGTEWVGFKRAAGGSAFVVPFDTPATKNNPGLTGSRMRQAKQGGYALPGFASGGALDHSRESASQVGKKPKIKRASGGVVPDGPGSSWAAGIPLVTLTTKSGKSFTVAKALAPRFKGFVDELESTGYKIRTIGGYRPDEKKNADGEGPKFAHPYGAAIDINPDTNGPFGTYNTDLPKNIEAIAKKYGLGWGRHFKDAMHFSAMKREYGGGINGQEISRASIMGSKDGDNFDSGTSPSTVASADSSGDKPETLESLQQKLAEAVRGLNQTLGYAPQDTSVEKATQDAAKAKDDKAKAAKEATNKATASAIKNATSKSKAKGVQNVPAASKPVILPGPSTIIPVEIAFAPTTSLYQPKIGTF